MEAAASLASTGDHEKVSLMHKLESELEIMLTNEQHYVEKVANDDFENGEVIILSAGMNAKKVAVHLPRQFKVKNTELPGQVKAVTTGVDRASFIWEHTTTPGVAANWVRAATTVKAQVVISGLTSGVIYSFRVAVVTKNGQGPWSNVLNLRTL